MTRVVQQTKLKTKNMKIGRPKSSSSSFSALLLDQLVGNLCILFSSLCAATRQLVTSVLLLATHRSIRLVATLEQGATKCPIQRSLLTAMAQNVKQPLPPSG